MYWRPSTSHQPQRFLSFQCQTPSIAWKSHHLQDCPTKNCWGFGVTIYEFTPQFGTEKFEASEIIPNFHTPNLGRLKRHWQVLHHSVSAQSLTIVPSWQSLGNNTTTSTVSLEKLLESGSIEMPFSSMESAFWGFLEFKITAGVGSFTSQSTWTNIFQGDPAWDFRLPEAIITPALTRSGTHCSKCFSCVKFDGWVLWLGESKSDEHGYRQYKGYCSPFDPRHLLWPLFPLNFWRYS